MLLRTAALLLVLGALDLTQQTLAAESSVVSSNIVKSAGAANKANGNGDVSPTGACKKDITTFCKDVTPGEGRLAACLTKKIRSDKQGNSVGRRVGAKCKKELADFKIDRSSNINKDIPLARACKDSVAKLCADVSDTESPGSVLACLRSKKTKLAGACRSEVVRTQIDAAEDFRFDYKLNILCSDDVANLCPDVEPGEMRELECLNSKRQHVSWECQGQLFRNTKESGDDIRLSVRLFNKCQGDYQKFCKDVEPGHMRVQECLEDNMEESSFSAECKEELDAVIADRVADFKLDTALRDACEDELVNMCATSLQAMDEDEKVKRTGLNCLQQYKDEMKSEECKAEMHRRTKREARDFRFNEVLAESCADDRAKYCNEVQMGSARVIRCLQDNRKKLDQRCTAALFDHEVRMAEDIDFNFPMKKACAWEIHSFCKDIPHGHARVIRCLQESVEKTDFSQECKKQVTRMQNRMANDYRLNYRLSHACESDINLLCPNECSTSGNNACGGLVLQCLTEKQDNITSQACQDEVFYYELMEVSDFRNDVILAEACREDVASYCSDVEPGNGRVHTCLRFNKDKISAKCRKQELKLQAIEYRDIRLRPKLNKLCSEEKAVYCKDVKPGKARVVKCLIENMAQPNFGEECKEQLQEREAVMKSDYRFDVGVATNCEHDVDMFCAEAKTALRGTAAVLKCLSANFRQISEQCQNEMSRAVRLALWDYKEGAPLTAACDADVAAQCPKSSRAKSGAVFTIGVVGRCLSKSLVEGKSLKATCRDMVLVAAPRDARAYFEYPESTSALVQRMADMQKAAGMDQLFVDPYQRNGSTVTVTGWVALACIISLVVVVLGGSFALYRRLIGADKPHTLHVKRGDL